MRPRPTFKTLFAAAPAHVKHAFNALLKAVECVNAAADKRKATRVWAYRLCIAASTLASKRSAYAKHGNMALLDKRWAGNLMAENSRQLPPATIAFLKEMADGQGLSTEEAVHALTAQLRKWRKGDALGSLSAMSLELSPEQSSNAMKPST